jgi:hypothetical protein
VALAWDAAGAWAEDSIDIILEVLRCQEAMEAVRLEGKGKEGVGCRVTVPALARSVIAYAPIVGKKRPTREARRAT